MAAGRALPRHLQYDAARPLDPRAGVAGRDRDLCPDRMGHRIGDPVDDPAALNHDRRRLTQPVCSCEPPRWAALFSLSRQRLPSDESSLDIPDAVPCRMAVEIAGPTRAALLATEPVIRSGLEALDHLGLDSSMPG